MPTSRTTDRPRGGAQAGFTLVELMLALAVMAMIAAIALPLIRPQNATAGLRAKAYQAAALLRSDRAAAQRAGRTVETRFDASARLLRSGANSGLVDLSEGLAVRLTTQGGAGFVFYPDGRSSGGRLSIATKRAALVLTVDDFTSAVAIRAPDAER